eukprot:6177131-Pleurochrysis_carterae.AAC.3
MRHPRIKPALLTCACAHVRLLHLLRSCGWTQGPRVASKVEGAGAPPNPTLNVDCILYVVVHGVHGAVFPRASSGQGHCEPECDGQPVSTLFARSLSLRVAA